MAAARASGMRVVGPNCLGIVNTDPEVRLNATLAPMIPGRGRVGFFAQSGSLGIALPRRARSRSLGLSTFVSAGNRADVCGNDLLQYWAGRPGHRRRAAVPGVLRQPAQVRPARPRVGRTSRWSRSRAAGT